MIPYWLLTISYILSVAAALLALVLIAWHYWATASLRRPEERMKREGGRESADRLEPGSSRRDVTTD